MGCANIRGRN